MDKTELDVQGMYDRFKTKYDQYILDGQPRSAHQMTVLMSWCLEQGAKA
jgi:hypothetical protein